MSGIRQAQLDILAQGLEGLAMPVAVVHLNRTILNSNAAFNDAFPGSAAGDLVIDTWARLGELVKDENGELVRMPLAGESAVRGSKRVRLQPVTLDGMIEPEWFVLVVERRAARRLTSDNVQQRFGLTPRQAEVALLLAQGHTTADIARLLDLTTHTVRHHAEKVLQRLDVRTRQQAMVRLRDGTARGPKARPSGAFTRP
jgi:DNA-binding CsgD family transcriptional regulator